MKKSKNTVNMNTKKENGGKKNGARALTDFFGIGAGFGGSAAAERSKKKK